MMNRVIIGLFEPDCYKMWIEMKSEIETVMDGLFFPVDSSGKKFHRMDECRRIAIVFLDNSVWNGSIK